MYIYRFINSHNTVIYIGRTNNLIRRLRNEHFTDRGHLPVECYNETVRVEFAPVKSQNEAKLYELYYIEQYHPKYNQSDIGGGSFSFELNELSWKAFDFNTDKRNVSKQELIELLTTFNQEIDTECRYAYNLLQNKDNLSWLNKLDPHEQNEYLGIIHSLERFVQGISERNTKIQESYMYTTQKKSHAV